MPEFISRPSITEEVTEPMLNLTHETISSLSLHGGYNYDRPRKKGEGNVWNEAAAS